MASRVVALETPVETLLETSRAAASQPRKPFALVDALNEEWRGLLEVSGAEVSRWALRHPALGTCTTLDEVLEAVEAQPDPALTALLTEVATGSRTAARTVLQSLLGKVVLMARRSRYAGVDDFVAALWCRIAAYPLDRRPRRIAANLALDTLKDVTGLAPGLVLEQPVPWPPGEHLEEFFGQQLRAAFAPTGPTAAQVISAAVGLSVIGRDAAAMLTTVYVDGLSSAHAAQLHDTTAESIRYHCSRSTKLIRRQLSQLMAAA